jgi:signal transduction histidine kinase
MPGAFSYARDPDGKASWKDAIAGLADPWHVAPGAAVSLGFTGDAVWMHAVLRNPLDFPVRRILEMPGTIDTLDLYVLQDGLVETQHTGKKVGLDARRIRSGELAFSLVLGPRSQQELWLRAAGNDSIALHPVLWTEEAFGHESNRKALVAAACLGALGTMALFNLFIWISLRDRPYLYYGLFQTAELLMLGALDGRTFRYFWPSSPEWAARSEMCFTYLALLAGAAFARDFLEPRYLPKASKKVFSALVTLSFLQLALALFTDHRILQQILMLTVVLNCATAMTAGIAAVARRSPNGPIFAAAWLILLISGILSCGTYAGLWGAHVFQIEIPRIGSVAEAVLLSFGLARRIKLAQKEKELIQGKLVEQERAQAQLLERRVTERTQELQGALQQLRAAQDRMVIQARLAALGHLIAGVAHEVGNPLNFVMGGASELGKRLQLLKAGVSDLVPEGSPLSRSLDGALQAADLVRDGSSRIHQLIENLRAYTRVRSRAPEPVDLVKVLEATIGLIEPLTKQQDITVVRDFEALPAVRSWQGELGQVFLNLLLNSCQAMPEGGTITLTARQRGGRVEVVVKDTGPGIAPAHREAVFDPFFTTRMAEGTGLGLSISARIVEDHQGELTLLEGGGGEVQEADAGEAQGRRPGATFLVSLPSLASLSLAASSASPT